MPLHSILIDSHIEERIDEFNERLPKDQKIESVTANQTHVFIVTADGKPENSALNKNLLLESLQKNKR